MKINNFLLTILIALAIISCEKTELFHYPVSKNAGAKITSISIVDTTGLSVVTSVEIDTVNSKIKIVVKQGTDKTLLVPRAVLTEGAIVAPVMGVYTDFSSVVKYTITAGNGITKREWTIYVRGENEIEDESGGDESYDSGFDYEINTAKWTLDDTKSDEFNQWNTSKWMVTGIDVSTNNGKLQLKAQKTGNNYTEGTVKSNFEIGENTFIKIRAKTINHKAMVNSFISLFGESSTANNPNSELTLMKTLLGGTGIANSFKCALEQTILPNPKNEISNKYKYLNFHPSSDFHIYGLERRSGIVRFYLDGEIIWEFATADYPEISTQLRNVLFGIDGVNGVNPVDSELPKNFIIDYIRVYNSVNSESAVPTYGDNLVQNPGFESANGNNPPNWTITRTIAADAWMTWVFGNGGHNSSTYRMVINSKDPFDVEVSQIVTVPNGLYRMEAYVKSESGVTTTVFAKNYGGNTMQYIAKENHNEADSQWEHIVIDNIYVDNGECELGLTTVSPGTTEKVYVSFDDITLYSVTFK